MLFKVSVSLLIFCLNDLSIVVSVVLKSPTISPFMLVKISFIYSGASLLVAYILQLFFF